MKKTLLGFASIALMMAATSCKNGASDSPLSVTENYAKAMDNLDFATARNLTTAESASFFDQMSSTLKNSPIPDSLKTALKEAAVKASNQKMINDSVCNVDIVMTFSKEIMGTKETPAQTYVLKKEKGGWKVDLVATMQKAMEQMQQQGGGMMPSDADSSVADSSSMSALPTAPDSSEK